jgi:hypothetical protein
MRDVASPLLRIHRMADSSKGPDPDEPEHADAELLFRDAPSHASAPPRGPVVEPDSSEGFALADTPAPAPPAPRAFSDPPPAPRAPRNRAVEDVESAARPAQVRPSRAKQLESASPVDQVWSRGAEWGPTLAVLGLWSALILFIIFTLLSSEYYMLALLFLAAGMVVGLVLCYPIVITMERPVRMTPEQAARDFYGALSHHRPHFRRMWLLLSNAGKTSSKFASFEGFRNYWVEKLKQLRKANGGASTPLTFLVTEFKSEKSGGKTAIHGEWKVKVFVRGKRDQGPIWSLPADSTFSKGPDGMWYLDDGTLAERSSGD